MSNRSSYRGSAAVALLAWCIAAPYATLASAAAAPTYYGTGISVRYHNGLGLDLHHPPQIPVGTRLNLGCSIKASGRSNPGWSIAIYANGHPLLVRPSTASDITLSRGGVYSIRVSDWKVTAPGRNSVSCHLAINGSNSELMAPGLDFNATGHAPKQRPHTTNWSSSPADSNWDSSPAGSSGSGGNSSPAAPAASAPASGPAAPTYYGTGITVRYHNGPAWNFHHLPQIPVGTRLDLGCSIKASGRSNPGWSIAINANGHSLLVRPSTASDITLSRGGVYSIRVSDWKVRRGRNTVSCHLAINGSGSELMAPGLDFNTVPRTKACKGAVTAEVELQPHQLGAPAWQAAGVQAPQIVLPLQSSASAGNAVTCIYSSVHGDVTVTTSLQCNNAHKQGGQNTYSCE